MTIQQVFLGNGLIIQASAGRIDWIMSKSQEKKKGFCRTLRLRPHMETTQEDLLGMTRSRWEYKTEEH